jgi:hypothetical protein
MHSHAALPSSASYLDLSYSNDRNRIIHEDMTKIIWSTRQLYHLILKFNPQLSLPYKLGPSGLKMLPSYCHSIYALSKMVYGSSRSKQNDNNTMAYLLKSRIVMPPETAVAREQHGNNITRCFLHGSHHVPTATGMHATIEELLEAAFSVGSVPMFYHQDQQDKPFSLASVLVCSSHLGDSPPGRGMGGRAAPTVESSCVVILGSQL